MTLYDHPHQEHTDQAPVTGHDLPPLTTIEDPARNAGPSSINAIDTQPSFLRRHLREAGVFAVGVLAAAGGLLAFNKVSEGSDEQITPKNPTAPSVLPPQVSQAPTTAETTPTTTPNRFAPETEVLVKTVDGYDIDYNSSPLRFDGGDTRPEINRDLIDEGLDIFNTRIEPALRSNGKKLLPVAMGECVFFSQTSKIKGDPTEYRYYTVFVNPVKIENGNHTTYYANTYSGHELMTVEKGTDGTVRASFGVEDFAIVNGDRNLETNMLPIFQSTYGQAVEPAETGIWGDSGSITYTQATNVKSSRAIAAAPVAISGPPDLKLSTPQQEKICSELLEQSNIASYRTR